MIILSDHNVEGRSMLLLAALAAEGWIALVPVQVVTFDSVGLSVKSSDREVWRFVQERRMILLTGNRSMKGQDALERTIREENTPTSLPVVTIGNTERVDELAYRHRCADRLIEIVVDVEQYLGVGRLFIP